MSQAISHHADHPEKNTRLKAFIKLGRPKFLVYSMILAGLGPICALYEGYELDFYKYLLVQCFAWCSHLMTHYCNEFFDFEADSANPAPTKWTGGSRVLVDGLISLESSLAAAHVLLFLSIVIILCFPTAIDRWLGLALICCAWFYTAPPVRFNYRGLGEFIVALNLNIIGPTLGYHLQTQSFSPLLFQVLLPTAIIQYVRMMIMNLSDFEGDRLVGKGTLIVRLGLKKSAQVFLLGQVLAYSAVIIFMLWGSLPLGVGAAILISLPISLWLSKELWVVAQGGLLKNPGRTVFWASSHVAFSFVGAMLGFLVGLIGNGAASLQTFLNPSILIFEFILIVFAVAFVLQVKANQTEKKL